MKVNYRRKPRAFYKKRNLELLKDYNSGLPVKELEKKYNIKKETVYLILRNFNKNDE